MIDRGLGGVGGISDRRPREGGLRNRRDRHARSLIGNMILPRNRSISLPVRLREESPPRVNTPSPKPRPLRCRVRTSHSSGEKPISKRSTTSALVRPVTQIAPGAHSIIRALEPLVVELDRCPGHPDQLLTLTAMPLGHRILGEGQPCPPGEQLQGVPEVDRLGPLAPNEKRRRSCRIQSSGRGHVRRRLKAKASFPDGRGRWPSPICPTFSPS